jgi:hypothetical protein
MLRGWSNSSFCNAVSRELLARIARRSAARGCKPAERGFALDAEAQVTKRRKLTVKGSGDITFQAHNKNSSKIVSSSIAALNRVITEHANQLGVPHQLANRVLKMTAGVRINGRPWKAGVLCYYFLTSDLRVDALPRIGQVQYFVVVPIGGTDHLFVCVDQRAVVDRVLSIIVYDVHGPPTLRIFHVDHLTHLVASLPYWHAGRPDIRCGVPIAANV